MRTASDCVDAFTWPRICLQRSERWGISIESCIRPDGVSYRFAYVYI